MAPLLDDMDPVWFYSRKENVFSFLPRKCRISGESLWFKKAWRVRWEDWSGIDDEWYCEREYLWKMLKDG